MPPVPVRRATPADATVVGGLLFDFNREFETPTPSAADFATRFGALLGRDDVVVLLAGDGDPLGFAYLTARPSPYFDGPLVQLEELYVRPALRDRGLGSALLEAAVAWARDLDAGELHIGVDEGDVDTRRFYERHGFSNTLPGTEERMLIYEREL